MIGRPALSSWAALLDYCTAAMARGENEEFRVLFLDRKNILVADEVQSRGTIDHTSKADIDMTRDIIFAAKALGITVHDHLVIGRKGHASFKSLNLL